MWNRIAWKVHRYSATATCATTGIACCQVLHIKDKVHETIIWKSSHPKACREVKHGLHHFCVMIMQHAQWEIVNAWREWIAKPVSVPILEKQTVTPLVLGLRQQIQKWGIVAIFGLFSTTIVGVVASKVTWHCSGDDAFHFEIKLSSMLYYCSDTLRLVHNHSRKT